MSIQGRLSIVPAFVKQWGAKPVSLALKSRKGGDMSDMQTEGWREALASGRARWVGVR